jgi:hypothetical protein
MPSNLGNAHTWRWITCCKSTRNNDFWLMKLNIDNASKKKDNSCESIQQKKDNGCERLQQCVYRETIESGEYFAEWNTKHVCDKGRHWCPKAKRLILTIDGQPSRYGGWGMMRGKKSHGDGGWWWWVMLGNRGETYRRWWCGLGKDDGMMRGVVLLYPLHSRPLASLRTITCRWRAVSTLEICNYSCRELWEHT